MKLKFIYNNIYQSLLLSIAIFMWSFYIEDLIIVFIMFVLSIGILVGGIVSVIQLQFEKQSKEISDEFYINKK